VIIFTKDESIIANNIRLHINYSCALRESIAYKLRNATMGCVVITIATAIAFVITAAPLNFQFGYSSLAKLDINKSRLQTVNELARIYKFNTVGNIDIRLINSPFNDVVCANCKIIPACHAIVIKLSRTIKWWPVPSIIFTIVNVI